MSNNNTLGFWGDFLSFTLLLMILCMLACLVVVTIQNVMVGVFLAAILLPGFLFAAARAYLKKRRLSKSLAEDFKGAK